MLTIAITARMRATIASGSWRLKTVTASIQTVRISTHSSSEPSWPPHTAANLYCNGRFELECSATYSTEKSLLTKDQARQPKAIATNTNWPCAAGRATAIKAGLPRAAPTSGSVACTSASSQREDEGEMSEFGDHFFIGSGSWPCCALAIASAASGGM